jgi:predicted transcriptional regulator
MQVHTATPRTITAELPQSVRGGLDSLGQATGWNDGKMVVEALERYIAEESAFVASLRESQEQARRRQFASPEKVAAFFAKKYAC